MVENLDIGCHNALLHICITIMYYGVTSCNHHECTTPPCTRFKVVIMRYYSQLCCSDSGTHVKRYNTGLLMIMLPHFGPEGFSSMHTAYLCGYVLLLRS